MILDSGVNFFQKIQRKQTQSPNAQQFPIRRTIFTTDNKNEGI